MDLAGRRKDGGTAHRAGGTGADGTPGSPVTAAEPARGSGETILLVEDEAALREATRQILTRNGYRVLAAATGPEALAILDQHRGQLAVLLTDVVMPQMPGKQLADKVRATDPGIQVLFMSGYTQGLLSAQGVLGQDVRLLEKPFDQATLLTRLNEALHAHASPRAGHPRARRACCHL